MRNTYLAYANSTKDYKQKQQTNQAPNNFCKKQITHPFNTGLIFFKDSH